MASPVEKRMHSLFYRPYPYFKQADDAFELPGYRDIVSIEELIRHGDYKLARFRAKGFIAETLEGLRYLQT